MSSRRTYRDSLPLEKVKEELRNGAGKQFDPKMIEVFMDILENDYEEIKAIQEKYK